MTIRQDQKYAHFNPPTTGFQIMVWLKLREGRGGVVKSEGQKILKGINFKLQRDVTCKNCRNSINNVILTEGGEISIIAARNVRSQSDKLGKVAAAAQLAVSVPHLRNGWRHTHYLQRHYEWGSTPGSYVYCLPSVLLAEWRENVS
jgi:hypothetical protein